MYKLNLSVEYKIYENIYIISLYKCARQHVHYIIITCHRVDSFITRHVFHFYVNYIIYI